MVGNTNPYTFQGTTRTRVHATLYWLVASICLCLKIACSNANSLLINVKLNSVHHLWNDCRSLAKCDDVGQHWTAEQKAEKVRKQIIDWAKWNAHRHTQHKIWLNKVEHSNVWMDLPTTYHVYMLRMRDWEIGVREGEEGKPKRKVSAFNYPQPW